MSVIDVGGTVRKGEELDIQAVTAWLKQQNVDVVRTCRSHTIFRRCI